mmetsp:Transcript_26513/g.91273  ORF Transcript_26513/g.91273 Transcript_26513/m.91273 type:complete len:340 (+) Transcript_26513:280-1299(+)
MTSQMAMRPRSSSDASWNVARPRCVTAPVASPSGANAQTRDACAVPDAADPTGAVEKAASCLPTSSPSWSAPPSSAAARSRRSQSRSAPAAVPAATTKPLHGAKQAHVGTPAPRSSAVGPAAAVVSQTETRTRFSKSALEAGRSSAVLPSPRSGARSSSVWRARSTVARTREKTTRPTGAASSFAPPRRVQSPGAKTAPPVPSPLCSAASRAASASSSRRSTTGATLRTNSGSRIVLTSDSPSTAAAAGKAGPSSPLPSPPLPSSSPLASLFAGRRRTAASLRPRIIFSKSVSSSPRANCISLSADSTGSHCTPASTASSAVAAATSRQGAAAERSRRR